MISVATEHGLINTEPAATAYVVPKGVLTLVLTDTDGTKAVWHRDPAPISGMNARCSESSPLLKLSRAELAVVRLVAEGRTNREIAVRLHVSHRTVDSHVSHALAKLGMTSRVQLAGFAVQHQL
jgi:DNA-binding NarL/FixJ family response regulator